MYTDEYGNRRFPELYRGVVFDNRDPLEKGRLQLQVPQVLADATTDWAWGKVPAGAQKYTPAIGEGVWVQFEGGDPSYPVWLGTFAQTLPDINAVLPATWDYTTQTIGVDQDAFNHISKLHYAQVETTAANLTAADTTRVTGKMWWDTTWETMAIGVGDAATLQVGQEFHILVQNDSGAEITDGVLVMPELDNNGRLKTVDAGIMKIVKAVTDGTYPGKLMLGITTEHIPNGERGMVTVNGYINGLNTNGWTNGDILYNNPAVAGGLTNSAPVAPNLKLPVAVVTKKSAGDGSIYARMTNGLALGELANVTLDADASTDNNEVLAFNSSTKIWQNKTATEAGLYGTTNQPTLDNLSDVVITSAASNAGVYYNGTNWVNSGAAGYFLSSVTAYTSGTTWTKPTGCRAIRVRLVGGGGAGGGASGGNGTRAGGGGGAGGYAESFIVVPSATSSYSYSIGAGGTGSSGSAGGDGGTTSFGSTLVIATGGIGGGSNGDGGTGGTGTAGNVTFTGGSGGSGGSKRETVSGVQLDFMSSGGNGGTSFFGGGGAGTRSYNSAAGSAGVAKGSGGGGGVNETGSNKGGDGAPGIIIVEVYV